MADSSNSDSGQESGEVLDEQVRKRVRSASAVEEGDDLLGALERTPPLTIYA
jgi:hypothetical protein